VQTENGRPCAVSCRGAQCGFDGVDTRCEVEHLFDIHARQDADWFGAGS
jgi:hypothetical protein